MTPTAIYAFNYTKAVALAVTALGSSGSACAVTNKEVSGSQALTNGVIANSGNLNYFAYEEGDGVDEDGKFAFSRNMAMIGKPQNRSRFDVAHSAIKRIHITVCTPSADRYDHRLLPEPGQVAQGGELRIDESHVDGIDPNAPIRPGVYILSIGDQRFIKVKYCVSFNSIR